MKLVAQWKDSRSKKQSILYRLVSGNTHFVIERLEYDALGAPKWVDALEQLNTSVRNTAEAIRPLPLSEEAW